MSVLVEFYGIPRARVGVSQTKVCNGAKDVSLEQVIAEVAAKYPDFAENCTDGRNLRDGYIASIDGVRFVRETEHEIVSSGQSVLILSADAGG